MTDKMSIEDLGGDWDYEYGATPHFILPPATFDTIPCPPPAPHLNDEDDDDLPF